MAITIVAEEQHARRIISHLITRRLCSTVQFSYLEGEYHIEIPPSVNLCGLRERIKGVEFYTEK